MTVYALDLWGRARESLAVASEILARTPDIAASRAYYAAFYAVSALFALEEKSFVKHAAVEAAVHRDLVNTGRMPKELGKTYSTLLERRATGDYGVEKHVSPEEARDSIVGAERILAFVAESSGGILRLGGAEGRRQ